MSTTPSTLVNWPLETGDLDNPASQFAILETKATVSVISHRMTGQHLVIRKYPGTFPLHFALRPDKASYLWSSIMSQRPYIPSLSSFYSMNHTIDSTPSFPKAGHVLLTLSSLLQHSSNIATSRQTVSFLSYRKSSVPRSTGVFPGRRDSRAVAHVPLCDQVRHRRPVWAPGGYSSLDTRQSYLEKGWQVVRIGMESGRDPDTP